MNGNFGFRPNITEQDIQNLYYQALVQNQQLGMNTQNSVNFAVPNTQNSSMLYPGQNTQQNPANAMPPTTQQNEELKDNKNKVSAQSILVELQSIVEVKFDHFQTKIEELVDLDLHVADETLEKELSDSMKEIEVLIDALFEDDAGRVDVKESALVNKLNIMKQNNSRLFSQMRNYKTQELKKVEKIYSKNMARFDEEEMLLRSEIDRLNNKISAVKRQKAKTKRKV